MLSTLNIYLKAINHRPVCCPLAASILTIKRIIFESAKYREAKTFYLTRMKHTELCQKENINKMNNFIVKADLINTL